MSAAAISARLNRPPRRAERCVACARIIYPVGGLVGIGPPPCQPLVTLELPLTPFCSTLLVLGRAMRARARLLNTGPTSAAAISGRLNRPPRRAERCVTCTRITYPVGGLVGIGPPPCQPVVTLEVLSTHLSAQRSLCSARFARARSAPQHWADERGCHLWAPQQAAPAGRALRGVRANNITLWGDWSGLVPPVPASSDPGTSTHRFCSTLLVLSAPCARAHGSPTLGRRARLPSLGA